MRDLLDRPLRYLLTRWEKQPVLAWSLSIAWVLLLVGIAFWWRLGSTGLVDETEPLFAEAARQMTVTGDWITPYFNEKTRFDKPPLVYWLMAIAYQTVGVNTWSARFPSALAATVLTGLGFYTLRYFGFARPKQAFSTAATSTSHLSLWLSAWIGAALLAFTPETIAWARIGVSDLLLSGCMGSALLAFFLGYAQPDRPKIQLGWYLAFYILSALAVLTKGPVGIVLPGLIIVAFLGYVGKLKTVIREMRLGWGSLLFLAIAVPWYILVIQANGEDFINAFFEYHNFERFTRVVNNHHSPLLFYFMVVPVAFAPWSIYLPAAIARLRVWRPQRWRQQPRAAHLGLFALLWFVIIFAFFTVSATKLPSYMIPLLPAAAILVGLFWSDQMTRAQSDRAAQISYWVNVVFLLLLAGAIFYSPHWMGTEPEMPKLPQVVQQSGITIVGAGIWLTVAIVSLVLIVKRQGRWLWSTNLVGCIAFMILTIQPMMTIVDTQRQLPLRQLAATIVQVQKPDEPIVMIGYPKPSLVFYTHQHITYIAAPSSLAKQLPKLIEHSEQHDAAVQTLLIVGRLQKLEEAGLKPDRYQTIADAGVFRLARLPFPPGSKAAQ